MMLSNDLSAQISSANNTKKEIPTYATGVSVSGRLHFAGFTSGKSGLCFAILDEAMALFS